MEGISILYTILLNTEKRPNIQGDILVFFNPDTWDKSIWQLSIVLFNLKRPPRQSNPKTTRVCCSSMFVYISLYWKFPLPQEEGQHHHSQRREVVDCLTKRGSVNANQPAKNSHNVAILVPNCRDSTGLSSVKAAAAIFYCDHVSSD